MGLIPHLGLSVDSTPNNLFSSPPGLKSLKIEAVVLLVFTLPASEEESEEDEPPINLLRYRVSGLGAFRRSDNFVDSVVLFSCKNFKLVLDSFRSVVLSVSFCCCGVKKVLWGGELSFWGVVSSSSFCGNRIRLL